MVRGDVITGIEDCHVRDLDSWLTCLENIWEADPVGYCVQNEIVSRLSNNSEGKRNECINNIFSLHYTHFTRLSVFITFQGAVVQKETTH